LKWYKNEKDRYNWVNHMTYIVTKLVF